jgi:hypothetical protein
MTDGNWKEYAEAFGCCCINCSFFLRVGEIDNEYERTSAWSCANKESQKRWPKKAEPIRYSVGTSCSFFEWQDVPFDHNKLYRDEIPF